MPTQQARMATPGSRDELAAELSAAAEAGLSVRVRGAGTKLSWAGPAGLEPALELSTARLDTLVEHNAGDLTAILEPGVPLARAQSVFAEAGQMLPLDPPDHGATVGGIVASADSGPLRSRYGGVRDLVVGMHVALSDGTRSKSGGKVIKNVAGYDLAKLFAGSFGSLGAILELAVRLQPLPPATATAVGRSRDAGALAGAASAVGHASIEHSGLDVRWENGEGTVLARFGGAAPAPQAEGAARLLREAGVDTDVVDEDDGLWSAQREAQRARSGEPDTIVRVAALQTDLPRLLAAATRHSALLVGRAPLGLSWLRLADPDAAPDALRELRGIAGAVVLDAPAEVRERVDPWGERDEAVLALMRRVKEGFDPSGVCAPGVLL
jgi:glycolate oxidase FAD binding subunit